MLQMDKILSICVVTRNREKQLTNALMSCLMCELPKETEFIIVDNGSVDHTETAVFNTLKDSGYEFQYYKLETNIGVGPGRNMHYEKSSGKYVFCMDDDAVIDVKKNPDFFIKAIKILDENPKIATLTAQIYDEAWKKNRQEIKGRLLAEDVYKCKMFCGGAHFLRKSVFVQDPYCPIHYGYEELLPSLMVRDKKMENAFCPELYTIHCPQYDKWDYEKEENKVYLLKALAIPYAIKRMIYPKIFLPVLSIILNMRKKRWLTSEKDKNELNDMIKEVLGNCSIKNKIKSGTVIKMFLDFGFSVF